MLFYEKKEKKNHLVINSKQKIKLLKKRLQKEKFKQRSTGEINTKE